MPATKMNRTTRSNRKRNRASAYAPSDDRNSVNTSDGSVMMKLFGKYRPSPPRVQASAKFLSVSTFGVDQKPRARMSSFVRSDVISAAMTGTSHASVKRIDADVQQRCAASSSSRPVSWKQRQLS